jgi:hypothetical protein
MAFLLYRNLHGIKENLSHPAFVMGVASFVFFILGVVLRANG